LAAFHLHEAVRLYGHACQVVGGGGGAVATNSGSAGNPYERALTVWSEQLQGQCGLRAIAKAVTVKGLRLSHEGVAGVLRGVENRRSIPFRARTVGIL
jgi:hypothetical protein